MTRQIRKAVLIGSGTMGGGIAALLDQMRVPARLACQSSRGAYWDTAANNCSDIDKEKCTDARQRAVG
jgi:3-hydroxyacyl-CoA dehydrogenase